MVKTNVIVFFGEKTFETPILVSDITIMKPGHPFSNLESSDFVLK